MYFQLKKNYKHRSIIGEIKTIYVQIGPLHNGQLLNNVYRYVVDKMRGNKGFFSLQD